MKCLLYALNGGRDEMTRRAGRAEARARHRRDLDYDEVIDRYERMMDWLAKTYVNALNVIHYMHDKYCYESLEMALHDRDILRTMGFGIAGLSHAADSLSAIKYAKVKPIRDETGLIVDFKVEGEFPCYGNSDDRADNIAIWIASTFMNMVRKYPTYRGRRPHAIGADDHLQRRLRQAHRQHARRPAQGRAVCPRRQSLQRQRQARRPARRVSVAKLPYDDCQDGISLTLSIVPTALGTQEERYRAAGAVDSTRTSLRRAST